MIYRDFSNDSTYIDPAFSDPAFIDPAFSGPMQGDAFVSPPRNRLGGETSPYLLQHAGNPIGWYPWGDEAFEAARREDKPVFLSIGYSSCHWCHVMERECFSDLEVADLMNDACIAIKVDREERPDLDGLFMEICHIQNGSGGWPLNLFLTPEGKPFFAATWLPKRTTGQMPGLTDILPRVKWLWAMQREDVLRGADSLAGALAARLKFTAGRRSRVGAVTVREALNELRDLFDSQWGGFGFAPKFPAVPRLLFLLEQARSPAIAEPERDELFAMADLTLRRMWRGGIHDHLGGGFARYATDEQWIVPHFEKMLADQALLLLTAALAHEIRPDPFYRAMAEDIAGCVQRDFTAPESCFWTSLDADSEEGEGLYYLWTEEEVRRLLPERDFGLFCAAYAILPGGNFGHELTRMQTGQNILYEASTVPELSRRYGLRPPEVAKRLARGRAALLEARSRRRSPARDDKVLMDWNGLMIGALARASTVFEQPDWRLAAERAALFLQKILPDPKGSWRRRYRNGVAGVPALPGDYAALLWGIMELHRAAAAADVRKKQLRDWLRCAETLAGKLTEEFRDPEDGGLFLSAADDPHIFLRCKTACDDAAPSANALAALGLAELGLALGERSYMQQAREIVSCFARAAALHPLEHLSLIAAAGSLKAVKAAEASSETEEGKGVFPDEGEMPGSPASPEAEPPEDEERLRRRPSEQTRRDRAAARNERRFSRTRRSGLKDR